MVANTSVYESADGSEIGASSKLDLACY